MDDLVLGDRLVCVDAVVRMCDGHRLTVGALYVYAGRSDVNFNEIHLRGIPGTWHDERFKKAPNEMCLCMDLDSGQEAIYMFGRLIHFAQDLYLVDVAEEYRRHSDNIPVVITRYEFDSSGQSNYDTWPTETYPWPETLDALKALG